MRIGRFTPFNALSLGLGLAFLYGPILLVVVFSFNASQLVTVWAGPSTRWYEALPGNGPLLAAAWTSLRIAAVSAILAVVLGTAAAFALVRAGRFRGRSLFTGLLYVPLVLPEVVTGLSLLLLFVSLGMPRDSGTVALAHTTLGLSFVTLIVQARLVGLDPRLEEAAADLGAGPIRILLTVTLPLLAPAIAAGFLLAFSLSLDDVVLASFTSGPGSTTLPLFIFGQVRRGVTPEVNAVSTAIIAFVALCLVAGTLWSRTRTAR